MQTLNSNRSYGWISILLHWIMAVALIGLYFVGDYMVGLTYYDQLYHTLPSWHKAIGVIVGILLVFRVVWVYSQPKPDHSTKVPSILHTLAKLGHLALYLLMTIMVISGYLISTAKGKGIDIFGWFEVPAFLAANAQRGELAGDVHEIAATVFVVMVGIHIVAALLHQFYWKDHSLTRMLGRSTQPLEKS